MKTIFHRIVIVVALVASCMILSACTSEDFAGHWISTNQRESCVIQKVDDKFYTIEIIPLKNTKKSFLPGGTGTIRAEYRDGSLHFRFFFAECVCRMIDGQLSIIAPQGGRTIFNRSTAEEIEALRPRRR